MYAHCQKILVKEGEKVEQGQVIATIGDTGLVTGPHLHYEILKDDINIDPIPYVSLPFIPALEP